jgi:hypothetical protein
MAAAATPEPPTGVSLIELALDAGYRFGDQRWRLHAACAGVDPEVFLPTRGEPFGEALSYCCRVRSGPTVWSPRSLKVSRRSGCGAARAPSSGAWRNGAG